MTGTRERRRNQYAGSCGICGVSVGVSDGWLYSMTDARSRRAQFNRNGGFRKFVKCDACHQAKETRTTHAIRKAAEQRAPAVRPWSVSQVSKWRLEWGTETTAEVFSFKAVYSNHSASRWLTICGENTSEWHRYIRSEFRIPVCGDGWDGSEPVLWIVGPDGSTVAATYHDPISGNLQAVSEYWWEQAELFGRPLSSNAAKKLGEMVQQACKHL